MKVYVENKDKMTSYQWGYDGERYSVKINFDLPSDKKVNVLSITDHDKQVRKEVCDNFKSKFLVTCQIECGNDTASFSLEVLNKILDQIEKGK